MNWVSVFQKTAFFIVTAVETSNLTNNNLFNYAKKMAHSKSEIMLVLLLLNLGMAVVLNGASETR
jgi:hypothetical protein